MLSELQAAREQMNFSLLNCYSFKTQQPHSHTNCWVSLVWDWFLKYRVLRKSFISSSSILKPVARILQVSKISTDLLTKKKHITPPHSMYILLQSNSEWQIDWERKHRTAKSDELFSDVILHARTFTWLHQKKNTYYYSKNFIFGFRAKEKLCGGFQNYVYPEKLNMRRNGTLPYQNQEKQAKFVVIDDRRDIPWASFIHILCGIAGKWLRVQWLRVCDNKYCGSHVLQVFWENRALCSCAAKSDFNV